MKAVVCEKNACPTALTAPSQRCGGVMVNFAVHLAKRITAGVAQARKSILLHNSDIWLNTVRVNNS